MKRLHQLNNRELPLCLIFNRANQLKPISTTFAIVSRLGDGIIWYVIMALLPFIYGNSAIAVSVHMGFVGITGLVIYKILKSSTERARPYNLNNDILHNVAALDQFSFPSGHTMHAVSFSSVMLGYYPEWTVVLVPFAIMIALSRVVLGLHYPSDVFFGALLGLGIAKLSFVLKNMIFNIA